jgi:hypothetical protein
VGGEEAVGSGWGRDRSTVRDLGVGWAGVKGDGYAARVHGEGKDWEGVIRKIEVEVNVCSLLKKIL